MDGHQPIMDYITSPREEICNEVTLSNCMSVKQTWNYIKPGLHSSLNYVACNVCLMNKTNTTLLTFQVVTINKAALSEQIHST